jgi:hypothetical protein
VAEPATARNEGADVSGADDPRRYSGVRERPTADELLAGSGVRPSAVAEPATARNDGADVSEVDDPKRYSVSISERSSASFSPRSSSRSPFSIRSSSSRTSGASSSGLKGFVT